MAKKVIQIKHITNSLHQMEQWTRYLRLALNKLDPAMLVSTEEDDGPTIRRPPPLASGCPPARPDKPAKKKVAKK